MRLIRLRSHPLGKEMFGNIFVKNCVPFHLYIDVASSVPKLEADNPISVPILKDQSPLPSGGTTPGKSRRMHSHVTDEISIPWTVKFDLWVHESRFNNTMGCLTLYNTRLHITENWVIAGTRFPSSWRCAKTQTAFDLTNFRNDRCAVINKSVTDPANPHLSNWHTAKVSREIATGSSVAFSA